jgi:hypothetical protein
MLRRGRFQDVVRRQLEIFAEEEAALLAEASAADAAWTEAPREESEELFGAYQLVMDAIGERLYDVREAYAATLAEDVADAYRAAFDAAALKRFRRLASFLEESE